MFIIIIIIIIISLLKQLTNRSHKRQYNEIRKKNKNKNKKYIYKRKTKCQAMSTYHLGHSKNY